MALCLSGTISLKAQTVKNISLSHTEAYADHVAIGEDSRDMDLIVEIKFNEKENSLTVSLTSYRLLFAFRENVQYSKVISWGKLRPNKFPYVVGSDEEASYKIPKEMVKSLPKKHFKYIFKRWIEYSGLQPEPAEYKMVNDYIEQKFEIMGKSDYVSISLRDILLLNKNFKPGKKIYEVQIGGDLNRKYEINLLRDPCLNKDVEIAGANERLISIRRSYHSLLADSVKNSKEALLVFDEVKGMLLNQYPKEIKVNPCSQIQDNVDKYNNYVDSILMTQCRYVKPEPPKRELKVLSPDYVLTMARRIDNSVARWKLTTDRVEKRDLIALCQKILEDVDQKLADDVLMTPELERAVSILRHAESYFYEVCKVNNDKKNS